MTTVVPQMKTGDMFLKKTTTIILLHRSSRQDYLNTVTQLQEKKKVQNMKWLHDSIQNKLQFIILNSFTISLI